MNMTAYSTSLWNGRYTWYIFEVFLEFFSMNLKLCYTDCYWASCTLNLYKNLFFPEIEIEIESEIVEVALTISSQTPAPNSLYFYLGHHIKVNFWSSLDRVNASV